MYRFTHIHGLRTPGEEIAFTERPKINSQSQIFRYGRSIFCLPQRSKFSDFYDLCLHWVSVVRVLDHAQKSGSRLFMPQSLLCCFYMEKIDSSGFLKLTSSDLMLSELVFSPLVLTFFILDSFILRCVP